MNISDLPYPTLSQFEQYGTGQRERKIYVGREFLKFRYPDGLPDTAAITRQQYVNEFFELVEEIETPFQEIYVSYPTLTEVLVWLQRQHSEGAAERCLNEVLDETSITVEQITDEVMEAAVEKFLDDTNRDPNFGEYLDFTIMQELGITYILTWDSDFCRFTDDLTLLPHRMWNTV